MKKVTKAIIPTCRLPVKWPTAYSDTAYLTAGKLVASLLQEQFEKEVL